MISIIVIYLYTFQNTLAKFNYSQEPLLNQELVILVTNRTCISSKLSKISNK